ncbi:LAGLIDADG family homing endonuclease [Mycolicibacterium canariasense]|nr:LAGLIDADG family homing endonuclease [Mycolicibacterium canariasense]ORV05393.1 hypothetical protein AWB94_20140 [Mycolicibacterium canariasense]
MRSTAQFNRVQQLIAAGLNDCQIARESAVPRRTVWDWRRAGPQLRRPHDSCAQHDYSHLPSDAYAYLLGLYLGDGSISQNRRVWRLRVTLDKRYPGIIESCRRTIDTIMSGQQATVFPRDTGCVDVSLYSKHWPCLFPQHGPGQKHTRPIVLQPWQQAHVDAATEAFIRGLIHSDGCRVVANDRGVRSVRYHFTNHSADIRNLYCAALDRLGIPWTQNSRYVIAVYRKAATARLDEFVGPKA